MGQHYTPAADVAGNGDARSRSCLASYSDRIPGSSTHFPLTRPDLRHFGTSTTTSLRDSDAGTAQTIDLMRRAAIAARSDPTIRALAGTIAKHYHPSDDVGQARGIFSFEAENIRFVHDPVGVELVQEPAWTLRWGFGDCDDQATLIAGMLGAIGIQPRFETVHLGLPPELAWRNGRPDFDHVYASALLRGQWVPLDTARDNPSFGTTSGRPSRHQSWEIDQPAAPGPGVGRLNGYMGDNGDNTVYYDPSTDTSYTLDANGKEVTFTGLPLDNSPVVDATTGMPITTPPAGLNATQIANLITQGGNAAATMIRAINTPGSPYYNPQSPYYGKWGTSASSGTPFAGIGANTWIVIALLALAFKGGR